MPIESILEVEGVAYKNHKEVAIRKPIILPDNIISLQVRILNITNGLDIGNDFYALKLPPYLKVLNLDSGFNQVLDCSLFPSSLESLDLNDEFNKTLENLQSDAALSYPPMSVLPGNLLHLSFGYKFNNPIDNLPHNLVTLKLTCYNQPITSLPLSLKELRIRKASYLDSKPYLDQKEREGLKVITH